MEERRMKIKSPFLMLTAFILVGCGGGRYWREDVKLADGQSIVIERQHKLGNPFDREPQNYKFAPPVVGHVIDIPIPGTKEIARWETDKPLAPLAVGLRNGTAYLAASPGTCWLYDQLGRPVPPYVFYKYEAKEWKRIAVDEFPDDIVNSNLLISTGTDALNAIESMRVTPDVTERLNKILSSDLRTIYRSGVRGQEDCVSALKAGWQVNKAAN
jgi:hypothetical protein